LTAIEGIGALVALTTLSEAGPELSRFKTEKQPVEKQKVAEAVS